jgi:FAD/FMN-containing dehydrogenase
VSYAAKAARLTAALAAAGDGRGASFGLAKRTSNLFRDRERARPRVDLSGFDDVIGVDAARGIVEVEGMATYERVADATLAQGAMPLVVPQLKSITAGGALAGLGIEATSFRHGLVHDTVASFDVLAGDGRIVTLHARQRAPRSLRGLREFVRHAGLCVAHRAAHAPGARFRRDPHTRHADAARCFDDLAARCDDPGVDFLDGVAFGGDDLVVTAARFVDAAPWTSDYTYERIYYRSLRERESTT